MSEEPKPFRVDYWRQTPVSMASCSAENANLAEIQLARPTYPLFLRFDLPAEQHRLDETKRALGLAAEWGKRERAGEIKKTLRDLIGL